MRGLLVGAFIALGLVVVPLGNLGVWTNRNLLDTERFVSLASDVVQEREIRDALADRIVEEIVTRVPRPAGTRSLIERGVVAAVRTSAFQAIFSGAAAQMHDQLERGDDELSLQLDGVLPIVRTTLASIDPRVGELVPQTGLPAIIVVRRSEVPALWRGVDLARTLSWALPIATVVLLSAGIALARRRGRALIVVGVGVVVTAIVVVALLRVGRGILSDAVGSQVSLDAFDAAWSSITSSLVTQTLVLALFGVLAVALGAFVISRTSGNERPTGWA